MGYYHVTTNYGQYRYGYSCIILGIILGIIFEIIL